MGSLKRHFLKGNGILDYGRLNVTDTKILENAVNSLTGIDKRGRIILIVRKGA